jgi:hypothetical protein
MEDGRIVRASFCWAHAHRLPVPGWRCSPLSCTERRVSQQPTGAQNRRYVWTAQRAASGVPFADSGVRKRP